MQERATGPTDPALQQYKPSNKRKRDSLDQGGDPQHPASKRGSMASNINGNGHGHTHSHSHDPNDIRRLYPDPLRAPNASQDFSELSQQLAQHVANPNHGLSENPNASTTAAAALAGILPQLTVPQPTDIAFANPGAGTEGDRQLDPAFDLGAPDNGQNHNVQGSPYHMGGFQGGTMAQVQAARESSNGAGSKPTVGSDEWHKVRRDNHKEGGDSHGCGCQY